MPDFSKLLNHKDYFLNVGGENILAKEGVFAPDPEITRSPFSIINNLPDVKGKSVLDLGSGTGVLGITCLRRGAACVLATDVCDKALANTRMNAKVSGLYERFEMRKSDLFEDVPESFDVILANLPILDEVWSQKQGAAESKTKKFLEQIPEHLNEGGVALFATASFTNVDAIREMIDGSALTFEEVVEHALGYSWHMFALTP